MLALFTIAHPLVDACSLSVLIAGGMSWQRVVAYNAMAFALQLPMGLIADERPGWVRGGFFLGTGMAVAAAVAAAFGAHGWGVLAVACVGNALFHLTAGKEILDTRGGRGGPIGLFISTGALCLLAGRIGMERCAAAALPAFAAALAVVSVASAVRWRKAIHGSSAAATGEASPILESLMLFGLFVLVAWRSWAGLAAGRISAGQGAALLFVAQLATGPVLSLLYDRTGRCGGMAFGLNCLGLFAGSL